jgi:hypothetical protein
MKNRPMSPSRRQTRLKKNIRRIVLTELPLTKNKDEVFGIANKDKGLVQAIVKYRKELVGKGVEVWERKENILVTELGYFFAMYADDPNLNPQPAIEGKIEPFMGLDGRMKVELIDKDGNPRIEDLAHLVAVSHKMPNPKNFDYVLFRDGNAQNCRIENLYWSEFKN